MVANGVVLLTLSIWILRPSTSGPATGHRIQLTTPPAAASTSTSTMPTKADIMALTGTRFGLSAPQVPWSSEEIDRISTAAGVRPTMLQYFAKWNEDFRADSIAMAYRQKAFPIISWEPWAGTKGGENQPDYALSRIINGSFDSYISRVAGAIRDQRMPVAIRLAHEMNGTWYPWSESRSGNKPGEYVQAWRHVHDLFHTVGADNVIWIWSPNILRPVPNVSLSTLYPGDDYVDWAGMVGYAAKEHTAAPVYEPTITALRKFTRKPLIITETGAPPSTYRVAWIKDFMRWLSIHPDVIGFNWFEYSEAEGGSADWRFTVSADTTAAFATAIKGVKLAPQPPLPTG